MCFSAHNGHMATVGFLGINIYIGLLMRKYTYMSHKVNRLQHYKGNFSYHCVTSIVSHQLIILVFH